MLSSGNVLGREVSAAPAQQAGVAAGQVEDTDSLAEELDGDVLAETDAYIPPSPATTLATTTTHVYPQLSRTELFFDWVFHTFEMLTVRFSKPDDPTVSNKLVLLLMRQIFGAQSPLYLTNFNAEIKAMKALGEKKEDRAVPALVWWATDALQFWTKKGRSKVETTDMGTLAVTTLDQIDSSLSILGLAKVAAQSDSTVIQNHALDRLGALARKGIPTAFEALGNIIATEKPCRIAQEKALDTLLRSGARLPAVTTLLNLISSTANMDMKLTIIDSVLNSKTSLAADVWLGIAAPSTEMASPRGIAELERYILEPSTVKVHNKQIAVAVLGKMSSTHAIAALERIVMQEYDGVEDLPIERQFLKEQAIAKLEKMISPEAIAALGRIETSSPSVMIKATAHGALSGIRERERERQRARESQERYLRVERESARRERTARDRRAELFERMERERAARGTSIPADSVGPALDNIGTGRSTAPNASSPVVVNPVADSAARNRAALRNMRRGSAIPPSNPALKTEQEEDAPAIPAELLTRLNEILGSANEDGLWTTLSGMNDATADGIRILQQCENDESHRDKLLLALRKLFTYSRSGIVERAIKKVESSANKDSPLD